MWTPFLTFTHVSAVDGSDPQTYDCATENPGTVSAAGQQFLPCLDPDSIPNIETQIVQRQKIADPKVPGPVTVRILSQSAHRSGEGPTTLSVLESRELRGQTATLAVIGTGGDGTAYTASVPYYLAVGEIVQVKKGVVVVLATGGRTVSWELTIQPRSDLASAEAPTRLLLGFGSAFLGDGVLSDSAFVSASYSTVPTVFYIQVYLPALPKRWASTSTRETWISHFNDFEFGMEPSGVGNDIRLYVRFASDAIPTMVQINGPSVTPLEDPYWASVLVDLTSGVACRFAWDDAFTDASSGTSHSDNTGAWRMFNYNGVAASAAFTAVTAVSLFSVTKTDEERIALQASRMTGDEVGLELFYPGTTNLSGEALDATAANASDPRNLSLTGVEPTTSLEGAVGLSGKPIPFVLQGQNLELQPMGRNAFRVAERFEDIRVWNRGDPLTVVHTYEARTMLLAASASGTKPTAGQVLVNPWSGAVLVGAPVGGEEYAADVQGCSEWNYSLALGSDHSDAYVTFPSAFNHGGNDFALEVYFTWMGPHAASGTGVVFRAAPWLAITYLRAPPAGQSPNTIRVDIVTSGSNISLFTTLAAYTTVAMRVAAREVSGDVEARLLVNGKVVDSGSELSATLPTTFGAGPLLSIDSLATNPARFQYLGVLPLRMWGPGAVGTTDAEEETEQRKFLYRNPVAGDPEYSDLLGMWTGPGTTVAVLQDEISTNHGTITDAPTESVWRPGLAASTDLMAAVYCATNRGGLDLADVDIQDSAYTALQGATVDLWTPKPVPVIKLIQESMVEGVVTLAPSGKVILGHLQEAVIGNAALTLSSQRVLRVGPTTERIPPTLYTVRWGRVGLVQLETLSGPDDDRTALISRPVGESRLPILVSGTLNADRFNDSVTGGRHMAYVPPGTYRDAAAALAAGAVRATILGSGVEESSVTVTGRGTNVLPGVVVGITDPNTQVVTYHQLAAIEPQAREDTEKWSLS